MFKKSKVCTAALMALSGGAILATAMPVFAQDQQQEGQALERVEVTGSRIKRAEAEGALPVTVIKREELDASGATTVAEFMRSSTFSSAGNFRPQSGSSAQSFAGIDLRGLGSARTLVLLDGRRLPKAPNVGDSVDLNTVPMVAVERIEILTDGASAVYGSDAIGGVVNIITRKDFDGVHAAVGYTDPSNAGGEKREASVVVGVQGEKGSLIMGVGSTKRGMVFTSQRPWGQTQGVSTYGNNYRNASGAFVSLGNLRGDPTIGCTDPNFWMTATGSCSYDFNKVAADEAEVENKAVFARGRYKINNDWESYLSASVSQADSFGRYAPTPAQLTVAANTPNNPTSAPIVVRHRTAAAGNRDTTTDTTLFNTQFGVQGKLTQSIELDVGGSYTDSKYKELGRNYIVRPILEQYVNAGLYDLYNPSANPSDVLSAIKATIGRDGSFKQKDVYAIATVYDLFKLPGGGASLLASIENRTENFADIYDSLSEAGVIEGSAGNSATGKREVNSASFELVMPLLKNVEASLAGRYEKYSDYGSDFAPKASIRWQPTKTLTLRASAGEGFRAPSLPQLNQKESFSAESVFDPRTCIAFGGPTTGPAADNCNIGRLVQVDTFTGANSSLKSEQSKQFALGLVWDPVEWAGVKIDYANIKIDDKITLIDAQTLIDRTNGDDPRPIPPGLFVTRDANGAISRVQQGYANEGTLKAQYLDLSLQSRWKLANFGRFEHELRWSHVLKYDDNGEDVNGTLGLPKDRAQFNTGWKLGAFNANWNINYIAKNGKVDGRIAGGYTTHDIQVGYTTPWKGKVILGMLNAFDKQPQLVAYDGRNFNFYLYDSYGRQSYVRYEQNF